MRTLLSAVAILFLLVPGLAAQGDTSPGSDPVLLWGIAPRFFPPGALIALVSGDPNAPGPLAVQLDMPRGYRVPPVFHPQDLHLKVTQGTLLVGLGDKLDLKKVQPLAVGDTVTVPAGSHYYYATKGRTMIAVTTTGPFVMTYVRPGDDPSRYLPFGR